MRVTKVVTKVGDGGTTRLVGNVEVSKDSQRIHCYGTVDELNSVLGVACSELRAAGAAGGGGRVGLSAEDGQELLAVLDRVQNLLFDLGADLATPVSKRWEGFLPIREAHTDELEALVESWNAGLAPLEEFVLPGGGPVAAQLHLARTVCRRAERLCVGLVNEEGPEVNPETRRLLNRLSDLLFVWARWAAQRSGYGEVVWRRE
jgi:cob(I)alamin adenosyltransferase